MICSGKQCGLSEVDMDDDDITFIGTDCTCCPYQPSTRPFEQPKVCQPTTYEEWLRLSIGPYEPTPQLISLVSQYRQALDENFCAYEINICDRAIAEYLYNTPLTFEDVKLIVGECNVYPFNIINNMITNIAYFYVKGRVSEVELEDIYIALANNARGMHSIFAKAKFKVESLKQRAAYEAEQAFVSGLKKDATLSVAGRKAWKRYCAAKAAQQYGPAGREDIDPVWKVNVLARAAKVKIPGRCQLDIPSYPPTLEQLTKWKNVETSPKGRWWAKTKPSPNWLFHQKKSDKFKICLPPIKLDESNPHQPTNV
jgi:hypothetical protein